MTFSSPLGFLAYASVAGVDAFLFVVFSSSALDLFTLLTFGLVPVSFLVIASGSLASDRETGFSTLLLTAPISRAGYVGLRFLAVFLLGSIAIALGVPYLLLLVLFGGWSWVLLVSVTVVAFSSLFFSVALGLMLAVLVGKRGSSVGLFTGFLATAILLVLPLAASLPPFHEIDPEIAYPLYRAMQVSPVMLVGDYLGVQSSWTSESLPTSFLGLVILGFLLLGLAAWIVKRLQNSEDWEVQPHIRIAVIILVIVSVLIVSFAVFPSSTAVDPSERGFTERGAIAVDLRFTPVPPFNPGQRVSGSVNVSVLAFGSGPVTFHSIEVRLRSFTLDLRPALVAIGDLTADPVANRSVVSRVQAIEATVRGSGGLASAYGTITVFVRSGEISFRTFFSYPIETARSFAQGFIIGVILPELITLASIPWLRRE